MKIGNLVFAEIQLEKDLLLFHGTDSAGTFVIPDGYAWFAFDLKGGQRWAGWSEALPRGRQRGRRRLLTMRLDRPVSLLDTRGLPVWRRLCRQLTGDPEANIYAVAEAVTSRGYTGWYGRTEVMLAQPQLWLAPVQQIELPAPKKALY